MLQSLRGKGCSTIRIDNGLGSARTFVVDIREIFGETIIGYLRKTCCQEWAGIVEQRAENVETGTAPSDDPNFVGIDDAVGIELFDWFDNNTLIYNFAWYLQNVKVSDEAAAQRSGVNTYSLLTHRERVILPPDYGWQATQEPVVDPSRHYVQFRDNGINDKWASAWYPFRRRMAVINLATRKVTNLTSAHDYPSCLGWLNNHELLAIMGDSTQKRLLQISVTGTRTQLALMPEQSDCPSVSSDEKYVLWTATDPYDITSAWIARTDGSGMHAVASLFEPLRGIATSRMTSVHWKSNDGLEIVGYLAYPLNYHPGKRYPTVVMLQGGPGPIAVNPDEFPGGVWFEQMLTARGYAVFRPDYREGGNYGFDKLLEARLGKLFEPSFNDIMSGVHSVEKLGVADPSHLYLMGHSYGSYTTNWLITHTHEFRAAVSYEGGDFFWEWGTYRGWNQSTTWTMRGTPLTRPEMYFANGPTFFASYMRTPTLFVVSENGIDSPAMAWLYAAERSLNINTEYILYKGEPHNIAQPANQLDLVNRILAWIKDN